MCECECAPGNLNTVQIVWYRFNNDIVFLLCGRAYVYGDGRLEGTA